MTFLFAFLVHNITYLCTRSTFSPVLHYFDNPCLLPFVPKPTLILIIMTFCDKNLEIMCE